MRIFLLCTLFWPCCGLSVSAQESDEQKISIEKMDDRLVVWTGEGQSKQRFTEYRFKGYAKPILYPVMAPGQVAITRHYPMEEGHENEAKDHPHHKSIWFAHGDVNGFDFWSEKSNIKHKAIETLENDRLVTTNEWVGNDQQNLVVCSDRTEIRFSAGSDWRLIDYAVTVRAHGAVTFGDTKEGTFAVRTHPALRIVDQDKRPAGHALNSEGIEDAAIWGKPARWVNYRGIIDGESYSITVMDHPSSLRSPTTWHAREYGLVAANPFGLSHFQKAASGTGNLDFMNGTEKYFRYGVLITRGQPAVEQINAHYDRFAR